MTDRPVDDERARKHVIERSVKIGVKSKKVNSTFSRFVCFWFMFHSQHHTLTHTFHSYYSSQVKNLRFTSESIRIYMGNEIHTEFELIHY